jgi:hypothetical protein
MKPPDKPPKVEPAQLNMAEVMFAAAFVPVIFYNGHDPATNTDNAKLAIRLGKQMARLMAEAR